LSNAIGSFAAADASPAAQTQQLDVLQPAADAIKHYSAAQPLQQFTAAVDGKSPLQEHATSSWFSVPSR
jgi:hypothetical protein